MPIVLSEHVLSELESLLAEVKHEIAKREAALASSATPETPSATSATGTTEVGSVAAPTPLPDAVTDANDTPAAAPPAARSGTLKRPPRTPAEPAAELVPVPAPPGVAAEDASAGTSEIASSFAAAPLPAEPEPAAIDATPTPEIRYVHPASRTLTWTGEGSTPEWITAYLAHGGSWTAMENAAEKLAARHRRDIRLMTRTPPAQRKR